MERIMLIVWKWRDFERKNRVVNSELLLKSEFKGAAGEEVRQYFGELFDYYRVCDQKPDGSTPESVPKAKVYRTYIEPVQSPDNRPMTYLQALIQYLKTDDSIVYVFLHRKDGFGDKNVREVLQAGFADKCFLIGGGRDNIYYREIRNQGLLGDNGYFFSRDGEPGKTALYLADEREKIVYLNQFNKVWNYYQHEFRTKIYELKEDYLSHFYQINPDEIILSKSELRSYLKKDPKLFLRISSFIDDRYHCLGSKGKKELDEFGRKTGKSYEFDDLRANLRSLKDIGEEYDTLSTFLYEFFYDANSLEQLLNVEQLLREAQRLFAELLNALQ